jgi:hypothetical protein
MRDLAGQPAQYRAGLRADQPQPVFHVETPQIRFAFWRVLRTVLVSPKIDKMGWANKVPHCDSLGRGGASCHQLGNTSEVTTWTRR